MRRRIIPKSKLGDKIDDFVIEEIIPSKNGSGEKLRIKCSICGRTKESSSAAIRHSKQSHKMVCSRLIDWSSHPKFHKTWLSIRWRTTNPNSSHYYLYGARGIKSDAFENFADFYDTMYESYLKAIEEYGDESILSIDRVDVNGNYCPKNCRWISMGEQAGNTRRNRRFKAYSPDGNTYDGRNQSEFAREHNIPLSWVKHSLFDNITTFGWKFEYIDPPYKKEM